MLASVVDSIRKAVPPIHREGYPFIGIAAAIMVLVWLIWPWAAWLFLVATLYVAFFFRDPARATPLGGTLVVSPADGRVTAVDRAVPPAELGLGTEPLPRVSIFLSVFDVHVNRLPAGGRIARIVYRPGKFLNADLDKASEDNERNGLVIEGSYGEIAVVQIAGLIARRIVCHAREGEEATAGERYGLIRFGSRLDVYFPAGATPVVGVGQTAVGGETILADLSGGVAPSGFRVG